MIRHRGIPHNAIMLYIKGNRRALLLVVAAAVGLCASAAPAVMSDGDAPADSRRITFEMTYNLSPRGSNCNASLVTLLPQTIQNRQTIHSISYTLEPQEVFQRNGNTYARFEVSNACADVQLVISVDAEIHRYDLETAQRIKPGSPLPPENLAQYLRRERYIETDAGDIKSAARLARGESQIAVIQALFQQVLSRLTYSGFQSRELGALGAWRLMKGDCTEYTDLLIALLRARGIPARAVSGLITNFSDVPHHNWVEVYMKNLGWVPLDPLHAAMRTATFEQLRPIYIYLSTMRNDSVLGGFAIWTCRMTGSGMDVNASLRLTDKIPTNISY